MTTPTKPTKEATTPLPVLTEALTPERVRELRDEALKDAESYDANDMTTTAKEWRDYAALADHWLRTQAGWIPVTERLPESGCDVLAYLINRAGKSRRIRAYYVAKHSVEPGDWNGDEDALDFDEKSQTSYLPEGWYESNEYEDTNWYVSDPVTHWRPLPPPPQEPA